MKRNPNDYRAGVGAVILNNKGAIFAGKRLEKFVVKGWQMPQGGIDDGEDELTALKREVYEETGIKSFNVLAQTNWLYYDLPESVAKRFWSGKFKGQRQIWFKLEFTGDEAEIDLAVFEPEFAEYKWSNKTELINEIVEFKKPLYQQVFKELEI
ncbi:MAG: RNA pyrophosphohydrolase [Rickettsiales bacterium]|nr:RNA pyrophosphohydrolase [Rickettsiales bacterium]